MDISEKLSQSNCAWEGLISIWSKGMPLIYATPKLNRFINLHSPDGCIYTGQEIVSQLAHDENK